MRVTFILPAVLVAGLLPSCDKGRGPEIAKAPPPEPLREMVRIPLPDLLPLTKVTVENRTGADVEGVAIRSEAFYLDVPSIGAGRDHIDQIFGMKDGCGMVVDFRIGGRNVSAASIFPVSGDGFIREVRLVLQDSDQIAASYRLKDETEFRTW